jgi:hypothetical protein
MDTAAWIALVGLAFAAGFVLAVHTCFQIFVPAVSSDDLLGQIERQRDTIDRLLARHFEPMTGDDARLGGELSNPVKQPPVDKPE